MKPFLIALVNSWNYHIGLEDAAVMQGQAHRIEDLGAPRMSVGGLGDDLIKRYWKWRQDAHESLADGSTAAIPSPYLNAFANNGVQAETSKRAAIPSGTVFGDGSSTISQVRSEAMSSNTYMVGDDGQKDEKTGNAIGTWGIKQGYLQDTPAANFPPMNYKPYANLLVLDDLVKRLFAGQEPSYSMIKTQMADLNSKPLAEPTVPEEETTAVADMSPGRTMVLATSVNNSTESALQPAN